MLATVGFDNQFCFQADKIGNVWVKHDLAAEFVTLQLTGTQMSPEYRFCIAGLAAE